MKRIMTVGTLCICCLLVTSACGPTKFSGDWESADPYIKIHFGEGANGFTGEIEWNGEIISVLVAQDFGNGLVFFPATDDDSGGTINFESRLFSAHGKIKGDKLYLYDVAEENILYELNRVTE